MLKWIKMLSLLILTAAADGYELVVRDGDEITLPCETEMDDLLTCDSITWIFNSSTQGDEAELVTYGLIVQGYKSDRLNVTPDCFLTIKNVTAEDVGQYICKQFNKSGEDDGPGYRVDLSVVAITEQRSIDIVTVMCSVLTHGWCRNTVRWMINGKIWGVNDKYAKITESACSVSALFLIYHNVYKSNYEFLTCSVTDAGGKEHLFSFYPKSPSKETETGGDWWRLIIVSVGLAALITAVVVVRVWSRGKPTKMDENTSFTDRPASVRATNQHRHSFFSSQRGASRDAQ